MATAPKLTAAETTVYNAVLAAVRGGAPTPGPFRVFFSPSYPAEPDILDLEGGFSFTKEPLRQENCKAIQFEVAVGATVKLAKTAVWQAVNKAIFELSAAETTLYRVLVYVEATDPAKPASALLFVRNQAENTALPVATTAPAAPTNLTVVRNTFPDNVLLSWTASSTSGVTYRTQVNNGTDFTTAGTTENRYGGLSTGVAYTFRVRAEKDNLFSAWVAASYTPTGS